MDVIAKLTRTLLGGHDVFNLECLLDDCTLEYFLLDCDFDFNALRMWLSPDETGIDDADFRQATKTAQTDRK